MRSHGRPKLRMAYLCRRREETSCRLRRCADTTVCWACQIAALVLRLQCRYLPVIHAGGAGVHRAVGRVHRRLVDIHNRADSRTRAFVLVPSIYLTSKFRNLVFEFTFRVGQRAIGLYERHMCGLNFNNSAEHIAGCSSDVEILLGGRACSQKLHCSCERRNGRCCFSNHVNPPVVDEGCVRAPDSTACGDTNCVIDGHRSMHRHDAGHGQTPPPMQLQALIRPFNVLVRGVISERSKDQLGGVVHQFFFRHFVHVRILRRAAGVVYSHFPSDRTIHAAIVRRSACNCMQATLQEVACQ